MKSPIQKKNLLIVDDVELFIQLQISHLGHKRYQIHTARSGYEGLQKARELKPDLILLDLFMPDMNGDQVCRLLKQDPGTASIPVVLVSSGSRDSSRAVSLSSDCDGLVFKPVRRDLLLSVVENLLGTNLRLSTRIQVALPGVAILEQLECPVTIRSLSIEGAFIEMDRNLIRGDMLELTFRLPNQEKAVSVRAAVAVWCGTLGEGGPKGAGVHFLTLDQEMRNRINTLVQERMSHRATTYSSHAARNSW